MTCAEEPSLSLDDGTVRIFLNTHGTNPDEVNPELVELLNYIEDSTESTANACKSPRIKNLHKRVQQLKDNEEVTVKYMNRWEELILERKEGKLDKLKEQIRKKLAKGKPLETIAEELEEDDISLIRSLAEEIKSETNPEG